MDDDLISQLIQASEKATIKDYLMVQKDGLKKVLYDLKNSERDTQGFINTYLYAYRPGEELK